MNIWAILPVKPLKRAKSRLAPLLSAEQRENLSRQLLEHTLDILGKTRGLRGVLVISRDQKALALARQYGTQTVQETGGPELVASLNRATQVVMAWDATGVLIIPSDLPLLQTADLEGILATTHHVYSMVISPDRRRDGTNALLLRPPDLIPFQFGAGSFLKHIHEGEKAGAEIHVYESPSIALDIDVPEDFDLYLQTKPDYESEGLPG